MNLLSINHGLIFLLLTLVDDSVEGIVVFPRNESCGCPPGIFNPEEGTVVYSTNGSCGCPPVVFNPEMRRQHYQPHQPELL